MLHTRPGFLIRPGAFLHPAYFILSDTHIQPILDYCSRVRRSFAYRCFSYGWVQRKAVRLISNPSLTSSLQSFANYRVVVLLFFLSPLIWLMPSRTRFANSSPHDFLSSFSHSTDQSSSTNPHPEWSNFSISVRLYSLDHKDLKHSSSSRFPNNL